MSRITEQPTLPTPPDAVIIPVTKPKLTVQEGVDLIRDLAAGQDGKHRTKESRNEALDSLKADFGISECEVQSLLMVVRSGDVEGVRVSLQRSRKQGRHRYNKTQIN